MIGYVVAVAADVGRGVADLVAVVVVVRTTTQI